VADNNRTAWATTEAESKWMAAGTITTASNTERPIVMFRIFMLSYIYALFGALL
jgi:hypothetical protein